MQICLPELPKPANCDGSTVNVIVPQRESPLQKQDYMHITLSAYTCTENAYSWEKAKCGSNKANKNFITLTCSLEF